MLGWSPCFLNDHHGMGWGMGVLRGSAMRCFWGAAAGALSPLTPVGLSEWTVRSLGVDGLITGDGFKVRGSYLIRWMGGNGAQIKVSKTGVTNSNAFQGQTGHLKNGEAMGSGGNWCSHSPSRWHSCSSAPVNCCHARKTNKPYYILDDSYWFLNESN